MPGKLWTNLEGGCLGEFAVTRRRCMVETNVMGGKWGGGGGNWCDSKLRIEFKCKIEKKHSSSFTAGI